MDKEEVFESAHKEVTAKFEMLRSWNVGSDTSDAAFTKEVCLLAMDKWVERFQNSVYIP